MTQEPLSLFDMTAAQLLQVIRNQPEQLPRMTSEEGDWRKLFSFLAMYSEEPNTLMAYLGATYDTAQGSLRDVVEQMQHARTVPGLFDREHVVRAVLDFSQSNECPQDQSNTLAVLALPSLRKQLEWGNPNADFVLLDMMIEHHGLATRNDLPYGSLCTNFVHMVIDEAMSYARLGKEQMGDSERATAYNASLQERLGHLLGSVVQAGGSLEQAYQFEVYGVTKSYQGALDMTIALDRNLCAGHGVIGALLDAGADWTKIDLDTVRPDVRAVFDQHPRVRGHRLNELAGGTREAAERRLRM